MIWESMGLFDREQEWRDLCEFLSAPTAGLRIGIVSGRRRQGKSFLLRRLCDAVPGAQYTLALEQERRPALQRFADACGQRIGLANGALQLGDWEQAMDLALRPPNAADVSVGPNLVVMDEFPYLLPHSPELPSVIQAHYDASKETPFGSPRLILCGSAVSVMSELLSGTKALRGRAALDLCLRPFDYRQAAQFWGISDPEVAFRVHAVLGGTAGYRDLIDAAPPSRAEELGAWLANHVLNPSHALFTESAYLLREDPRITDRALYYSVLSAISAGATTSSKVARAVGRPDRSLAHPLDVLRRAGFVRRTEDVLLQRRAKLALTDPIVRFQLSIMMPRLAEFEERRALSAWEASQATFSAQILGPHFEDLAREWTASYAKDEGLGEPVGPVGPTVVNDPAGRTQHEIDVAALASGEAPRTANPRVIMLGEAKSANRPRSTTDLRRLEHIRGLLTARGVDGADARLALFGRTGFDTTLVREAARRPDVLLIDLAKLYGVG